MSWNSGSVRPFMVATALVLSLAAGPSHESSASSPDRTADMYSITISGGVSLGAYEAGFAWTVVRFFKVVDELASHGKFPRRPWLAGFTGASAGAINALLSAALWCEESGDGNPGTVDQNLLHDSWLSVGFDDLLPQESKRYRDDDGLFARSAFDPVMTDIRREVFGQGGTHRFTPGCRIPVGITVTRAESEERDVSGLRTVTQRFVLPWMLEVSGDGKIAIRNQNLTPDRDSFPSALWLAESTEPGAPRSALNPEQVLQAILASSAFPVAFSPRVLCDCSARCPADQIASTESCSGADGKPLTDLTCSTRSGEPEAAEVKLCRRSYVDGGVFDNAPIGLAIDQVETSVQPTPLRPVIYVYMDPDTRRLKPRHSAADADEKPGWGITGNLSLFGNLVRTARNVELSRVVQAKNWNLTTKNLLREAAVRVAQFVDVHETLNALARDKNSPVDRISPAALKTRQPVTERLRLGRVLFNCLKKVADADPVKNGWSPLIECAAVIRESSTRPDGAAELSRLSKSEVVEMGRRLVALTSAQNPYRRQIEAELFRAGASLEERGRTEERLRDRLWLTFAAIRFLAEEVDGVARSQLPEEKIYQFKDGLLTAIAQSQAFSDLTTRMTNSLLEGRLQRVQTLAPQSLSSRIQTTRESLISLQDGELFVPQTIEEWIDAPDLLAGAADRDRPPLSLAVGEIRKLLQFRPTLLQMRAAVAGLVRGAAELQRQGAGERRLYLTSRFAPLAGSQLNNFAAFLDRPLRELDYYAGVYDAIHEVAAQGCNNQDVYVTDRTAPVRRRDAPSELDMTSPDTQRCVGEYMDWYVQLLEITASERARTVFSALAQAELLTALGSASKAAELLQQPSWNWLMKLLPVQSKGPLASALMAMLSRREPCTAQSQEALCVAEPTFDQFLASLQEFGYQAQDEAMKVALSDRERWWSATLQRSVARASAIESTRFTSKKHPMKDTVSTALNAGQTITRRDWRRDPTPRLELDPSTIPGEDFSNGRRSTFLLVHLIPYRIALDVARGGLALAWLEPALRLWPWFSVLSVLEPVSFDFSRDRFFATVGIRPTVHFSGASLGAGPALTYQWGGEQRSSIGLQANLAVLQDRVGVSVGVRDLSMGDTTGRDWFVALSLSDVNGMLYWLALH